MDLTAKVKVKRLPTGPGVYLFRHRSKILYVGKAINLRRRVSSYFNRPHHSDPKTQMMVTQVTDVQTMDTASEFDAILLEARLIREFQPKYNVIARDDKSPLYVVITLSEILPRLILARKNQLSSSLALDHRDLTFGPFQSAKMIRSLLRELRQVIPFCLAKRRTGKPCFYTHLNLCNPCPSEIVALPARAKRQATGVYRRHLRQLASILSGKTTRVKTELYREMRTSARREEFEEAVAVRKQLASLDRLLAHHYDPAVYIDAGQNQDIYEVELAALQKLLQPFFPSLERLRRIECVDIANLQGQAATGSLVVFSEGRIDQDEYRHFRIKTVSQPNDTAMMTEVVSRRLNHPEWELPQLLIVDGGKPQVSAARAATAAFGLSLPVVGLSKRWEEMVIPKDRGFISLRLPRASPALHLIERLRDEAHRFARRYYQHLRRRSLSQTLEAPGLTRQS